MEGPSPAPAPPPPAPKPPRVWTVFVGGLGAIIAGIMASAAGVAACAAIVAFRHPGTPDVAAFEKETLAYLVSPSGLLLTVLPGQFVFLMAPLLASRLSAQPWRERLGLVRGSLPMWALPVLLVATLFVQQVAGHLGSLVFGELSEELQTLVKALTSGTGAWAVAVLLCASVLPGITEELLFRGYVQRRLLQRWTPALAIGAASAMFALAHVDPQHMLIAFVLGLWLGVVAWRTGSVWPAMACHFFNNFAAVLMLQCGVDPVAGIGPEYAVITWGVPLVAFIAAIVVLRRAGHGPLPGGT